MKSNEMVKMKIEKWILSEDERIFESCLLVNISFFQFAPGETWQSETLLIIFIDR